jgi:hypothetical protein
MPASSRVPAGQLQVTRERAGEPPEWQVVAAALPDAGIAGTRATHRPCTGVHPAEISAFPARVKDGDFDGLAQGRCREAGSP